METGRKRTVTRRAQSDLAAAMRVVHGPENIVTR
jgi:hypothetical protein